MPNKTSKAITNNFLAKCLNNECSIFSKDNFKKSTPLMLETHTKFEILKEINKILKNN